MSDCGCVYVEDDGDPAVILGEKIRRAHKAHKCDECRGVIEIGETYEDVKGLSDGSWFRNKTCSDCLSIRRVMFCGSWNYGSIKDDLWEHVSDFDGQIDEDCLLRLTPRARSMVADMIDQVWEMRGE